MKLKQENANPFLYIMLYNPTLADPQLNKQDLSAVIFKCFRSVKFITLFLLLTVVDSSNQRNFTEIVEQTQQYTIHLTLLRFALQQYSIKVRKLNQSVTYRSDTASWRVFALLFCCCISPLLGLLRRHTTTSNTANFLMISCGELPHRHIKWRELGMKTEKDQVFRIF